MVRCCSSGRLVQRRSMSGLPELVRTAPRPHRAFQGWRYYAAEDAPLDLEDLPTGVGNMPPELVAELHELGLL